MNQNDLIQRIIATEHQAQTLTESAKKAQAEMEQDIAAETAALRARYQAEADRYLQELRQQEQEKSARELDMLKVRLQEKLDQIETIYAAEKEQWTDAIFSRIVGKAGG